MRSEIIKNLKHKNICIAIFLIIMIMGLLIGCSEENAKSSLSAEGELEIHFIDVGQADCTLLISDDKAMMIDAGNQADGDLIVNYLGEQGVDKLDYLVFTHPHEDHIGGGLDVINNVEIGKVFMLDEYDSGIAGSLNYEIETLGLEKEAPYVGETIEFGECLVEFLGPSEEYSDANDDSICLKVTHGENKIMFTGDAGSGPERAMIESGLDLSANLFKAGHHGSSTSNSYYFLRESNPEYVVISCEKGNMYGHPHEEAMSRFNDLGAEVFRTDEQGTIIAVSDGQGYEFNCEGKKADKPHTENFEEASYIGNINSKKYHSPDCGGLPNEENRVYFNSVEAAEKAGYSPCGNCRT